METERRKNGEYNSMIRLLVNCSCVGYFFVITFFMLLLVYKYCYYFVCFKLNPSLHFYLKQIIHSFIHSFICITLQEYHRIPPSQRTLPTISESSPSILSTLRDIESANHFHPSNNLTRNPSRAVLGCCLQANRSFLPLLQSNNINEIIHALTQIQRRRFR